MPQTQRFSSIQPAGFPSLPDDWDSEWGTFSSHDGKLQLFEVLHHSRQKDSNPRTLFVLHGMGEHAGRYLHFPHFLRSAVGSIYTYDHRGHGRSEGTRGHTENIDDLVEDAAVAAQRLFERLKKKGQEPQVHLFGHSLGGHLALRLLHLHPELPFRSATISAPFLAIKAPVPAAKKVAARALSRIWGSLQLDTELDASGLSHDSEVIATYQKDRLVHSKMTPRFFSSLDKAFSDTFGRTNGIQVPTQFLIPMEDPIVDPDRSIEYFKRLEIREKRLQKYPGFYHESFNEKGKEQAFSDLAEWISKH